MTEKLILSHTTDAQADIRSTETPAWAEIDLPALTHNTRQMKARVSEKGELIAIVKSDAYGHGLVPCAQAALRGGADRLAIGYLAEARALRESGYAGKLIKIVPSVLESELTQGVEYGLEEIAADLEHARLISNVAQRAGMVVEVHVKVDTGMGRLGIWWSEAAHALHEIRRLPGIRIAGIMSHLPEAESENAGFSHEQVSRFRSVMDGMKSDQDPCFHLANSAGGMYLPESHFSAIRAGISLYGLSPRGNNGDEGLRPVMSVKTHILQVKEVPAGESIGYGRTARLEKPARIAVLPVGYADGLPRGLSNKGAALVCGRRAPIMGIVSMNLTAVDVTKIPEARRGDQAVLLGRQTGDEITAQELAEQCGTIHYEIVTRFGRCCRRVFAE